MSRILLCPHSGISTKDKILLRSILYQIHRFSEYLYDKKHGIRTSESLPTEYFVTNDRHELNLYIPADRTLIRKTFKSFPHNPDEFTFIDIGCGRGRVLFEAEKQGFARVIGIELEPSLAEAARHNIRLRGSSAEVAEIDAAKFSFPAEDLFIFMFNPAHEAIMARIIENLKTCPAKRMFVAYMNPAHGYLLQQSGRFRELGSIRKTITVYPWDGFPVILFERIHD